ncbi:MAG: NADH:ubiquinone reductase (Na(+)-transporting) subunit B [Bacteroidales bacterium]|jgi:Na+-transporting NADH:ubiquinone oxidoreductase subunit B
MKSLRKYIDKIKPKFTSGGKYAKLESTFDAFETFLFVPNKTTFKGSHIRDGVDLKRTMSFVIIALIPALLFGIWNTGYQHNLAFGLDTGFWSNVWYGLGKLLPLLIVSYVCGLGVEFIFAQIRKHEVNEGFLVTGMLIPLIMPADVPLWMVAIATIFAVIIGKEAFGGTGMNIFNPALLARAFVFFAYPSKISGDVVWVGGLGKATTVADGFTGATPLSFAASGNIDLLPTLKELFIGVLPGSIGETSKIAIILGAIILLISGIGSWRIMLSALLGGVTMSLIFNAVGANAYMTLDPLTQIMMGSFLFGIVFMATDPVTAAQTNKGKWIYGFLIGIFAIMIRVVNPAYPEGTMMAILLMNAFAPLIDHYVVQANIKKRLKRIKK